MLLRRWNALGMSRTFITQRRGKTVSRRWVALLNCSMTYDNLGKKHEKIDRLCFVGWRTGSSGWSNDWSRNMKMDAFCAHVEIKLQ